MIDTKKFGCALAVVACIVAQSCSKNDPLVPQEGKYGLTKEVKLFSEGGTKDIAVTSTGKWNATLSYQSKTWISLVGDTSGEGDGTVSIKYKSNDGLPRLGVVYVASETRMTIDTILVKQYGIVPAINLYGNEDTLSFTSVGSSKQLSLDSNLPASEYENLLVGFSYEGEDKDWAAATLSEDLRTIDVTVPDNTGFNVRKAQLVVRHTDAWGVERMTEFPVAQGIPGGTPQTVLKSFAEVRALIPGGADTLRITDDIMIQGLVISDKASQNMGDCPEVTEVSVDYTQNNRTAYIESEDGGYGFRLLYDKDDDNTLARYDNVKLWIKGALLTKEMEPERYTISGLGSNCVVTSVAGTAESLPVKKRYIKDLQDNDLYTYVTLKKCEFPVRRGGLVMFYNTTYMERMSKYAQIVADINGNTIRALYNLKSPIATSTTGGSPKGQGPVSGIIVHEKYYRFSPADGEMGRYQIRNVAASDIQVSSNESDNFFAPIVEWADCKSDGTERRVKASSYGYTVDGDPWVIKPTYGTGAYYFYNITSPKSGLWPGVSSAWCTGTGVGAVSNAAYGYKGFWNKTAKDYNYAVWKFSTRDISSSMVTFSLAGRGYAAAGSVPYWNLEYSVDEGASWKRIGEFTIVAQTPWSSKTTMQGTIAGETSSYFVIPNDILGLDVAMVRMIPSRDIMGSAKGWNASTLSSGSADSYTLLCYSAIRYKK